MKTYLELEGNLGPKPMPQPQSQSKPSTSILSQSSNPLTRKNPGPKIVDKKRRTSTSILSQSSNPLTRKTPGPKIVDKEMRTRALAKTRYKVRVIAQPILTTPMPTVPVNVTLNVPIPTVATTSTQMPVVKSAAMSILVMVYNLVKGKFDEVPYPTEGPRLRKILPFTTSTPTLHHFKLFPMPNLPGQRRHSLV